MIRILLWTTFLFLSCFSIFLSSIKNAKSYETFQFVSGITGSDFLEFCRGGDTPREFCLHMISGLATGISLTQSILENLDIPVDRRGRIVDLCAPRDVSVDQLLDVTLRFIEKEPAYRHEAVISLLVRAIHDTWNCSRN